MSFQQLFAEDESTDAAAASVLILLSGELKKTTVKTPTRHVNADNTKFATETMASGYKSAARNSH